MKNGEFKITDVLRAELVKENDRLCIHTVLHCISTNAHNVLHILLIN